MLAIIKRECDWQKSFEKLLTGKCKYFHYSSKQIRFLAPIGAQLRKCAWLMDHNGSFASPSQLTVGCLNDAYDLSDDAADELIRFLRIKDDTPITEESNDSLTDEQREADEIVQIAREWDLTPEELRAILVERERQKNAAHSGYASHSEGSANSASTDSTADNETDRTFRKAYEKQSSAKKSVLRSMMEERSEESQDVDNEDEGDSDEYTPPSINYSTRIEREVEKSKRELDKIAREKELSDRLSSGKYTYGWFCALMELEAISGKGNESGSREISISFGKVEPEPGSDSDAETAESLYPPLDGRPCR